MGNPRAPGEGFFIYLLLMCASGCTATLFDPIGDNLSRPVAVALDTTRNRAYVVNANTDMAYQTGSVMVLDLSSPAAPVRLNNAANPAILANDSGEVYLDATNRFLYIANRASEDASDTVDQVFRVNVDESSSGFMGMGSAEASLNPIGLACCDSSSRLYAVGAQGYLDVYPLDLSSQIQIALTGMGSSGGTVSGLAATRAVILGQQLFVTTQLGAIFVINTAEVGASGVSPIDYVINGGTSYAGIATDGTLLYAVDAQSPPKLVILAPAVLTPVSPDLSTITEKAIGEVKLGDVDLGSDPQEVIIFGGNAYVSNRGSNTVSVINLASRSLAATIPVGTEPFGLAAGTFGADSLLYVTNVGSNNVSIINLASNTVVGTFP